MYSGQQTGTYIDISTSQQTTTRDFTCSVSEFTSSTGSIHVNSPDIVNKFGVLTRVSHEITSFFRVMTRANESIPVLTQYNSCQTRSKLVTTDRTRVFM